jgi:hypothetical protein
MHALAQTYSTGGGGAAVFGIIFSLLFFVLAILPLWFIFTKAGEEGWKAIIPIYNWIVLLKIVGRPWWYILLFLIPIVNIIILIIVMNDLSKSFGHGPGFTVGLVFLNWIFLMILAFGSSRYRGPAAAAALPSGSSMPPPAPPPAPPAAPPAAPPPPPTTTLPPQ